MKNREGKILAKNYLKEIQVENQIHDPFNEHNEDLEKIVQRKYLLKVYGVTPKNRDIIIGDIPETKQQFNAKSLSAQLGY